MKTIDEDFKKLYERVDWFLKWLGNTCPDTFPYIAQEWLRSSPACFGSWAREKMGLSEITEDLNEVPIQSTPTGHPNTS